MPSVYVTGNPQYENNREQLGQTFHAHINVWKEHWDEETQTVTPSAMTDAMVDASENYPKKRILAHYVQPHVPFIGKQGRERFPIFTNEDSGDSWNAARNFWPSIRRKERDFSRGELVHAYLENIEVAMDEIIPVTESLDGKVVITSDHGQLLGERIFPIPIREYGHPGGLYVPELTKVPLHTLPFEARREITEGDLEVRDTEEVQDSVSDRLNALGYK